MIDPFPSKYLRFLLQPRPEGRRTDMWTVWSISDSYLGYISWYGRWRQFTFHPEEHTTYSAGCLHDIERFIEQQMEARKAA